MLKSGIAMREELVMKAFALPTTPAGRVSRIMDMLGGQPIFDEDGNDTGEVTPQLISKRTAMRLLAKPVVK